MNDTLALQVGGCADGLATPIKNIFTDIIDSRFKPDRLQCDNWKQNKTRNCDNL